MQEGDEMFCDRQTRYQSKLRSLYVLGGPLYLDARQQSISRFDISYLTARCKVILAGLAGGYLHTYVQYAWKVAS